MSHRDHISLHHALSKTIGSAVCFVISLLTIWPVLTLLGYHCRVSHYVPIATVCRAKLNQHSLQLIILNITTIEQVRSQARNTLAPAESHSNPFTLGRWTRNIAYTFCRPAGYSWIQADEVAMEDRRIVNPGIQTHWKSPEEDLYGRN